LSGYNCTVARLTCPPVVMKKFWHSGQLNISARDLSDLQRPEEDAIFTGTVNLAYVPESRKSSGPLEAIREVSEEWEVSGEDVEQRAASGRGFRVSPIMEFTTEHEVAEMSGPPHRRRNVPVSSEEDEEDETTTASPHSDDELPALKTQPEQAAARTEEKLADKNSKLREAVSGGRLGEMVAGGRLHDEMTGSRLREEAGSRLREEAGSRLREEAGSRLREEVRRAMLEDAEAQNRCREPGCPYNLWLYGDQGYPSGDAVLYWEETVRRPHLALASTSR
jgi:hypothetical protein